MRRFLAAAVMTALMFAISAAPASAATLRVSRVAATASTAPSAHVHFSGAITKTSRVRVAVYRGTKLIRTLTASVKSKRYTTSWNLKTSSGTTVDAGTYSYKVTALAAGRTATKRGRVLVPAPTPVLAPAPVPAPAPAPAGGRWIGFYQSGAPSSMDPLTTLEAKIGTKAAVVNFYVTDTEGFPVNRARSIADHGSIPMITLEFWSVQTGGVDAITSGSKDAALIKFADAAKAHGTEIWLRPFHEMNSNWYPWAGATNGNSAAKVVAAWKHVKDLFVSRGATNVKFVWCVNNESVPNVASNAISAYWPGDAYVDQLAIDGYNFGTSQSWSTWRSFNSVISDSYAKVTALSAKPLFLAETGSVEQGGNKAAWMTDMFNTIKASYPRIAGVCWFNVNDTSANTDWRVDSSTASLDAFKLAMASGF